MIDQINPAPPQTAQPPRKIPNILAPLGYAGLVPFVGLGLGAWWVDAATAAQMLHIQLVYAAVILSFLGAVHWGLALAANRHEPLIYIWGVVPSLLGWAAACLPLSVGAPLASVSLVVCWVADRRLTQGWPFATSYMRLRTRLTFIAWLALVLGRLSQS